MELKNNLISGMSITEFAKFVNKPTQYASVIAHRLQKLGLVSLPTDYDSRTRKRITRITLTKEVSPEELHKATFPGTGVRDNNFIAPDLTPRIREAVDLRLAGHSESQIANRLGISRHTVGTYLTLARHPEKYIKYREKKEYNISSHVDQVHKLLTRDGYVLSGESNVAHFSELYQHFRRAETANCVEFPYQKKFYGSLAGKRAIYSNKKKFAGFLASKLMQEVFENFSGYSIKRGGRSRSVGGFAFSLASTFHAEKAIIPEIWSALKGMGLRIDGQRNITVESSEPDFVTLTEGEISRMREIMTNIGRGLASSGEIYKECKAFTNFFERTARKHNFEPSKATVDLKTLRVRARKRRS